EDDYSRSFVKMVAELARTIGVHVCVEGIETEVQYEALADMKIKYIQGYYFDMALSKDAFEEKYIAKKRKTAKTVQK
ncbi:MAG: EAL domain-containing protein, partial [Lachnospiraceae bacterium]|nr:EAL domain-containing protein [Lachnospiraceae bacterium]